MAGKKTKKVEQAGDVTEVPQDLTGVHRIDGEKGVSVVLEVEPGTLALGFNSRIKAEANQTDEDLKRAYSIFKNGQKVPCIVRRLAGGTLELVAGGGRKRSVELIRKGFEFETGKDKVEKVHEPEWKLRVAVDDTLKGDKEAFIASVVENQSRNEVSPINLALQQRVLRDDFKLGETAIAKIYGYNNANAINRSKKLLECSREVQDQVHSGDLSVDAALKLAELSVAEQQAVLTSEKRITAAQIGELIAAKVEAKAEAVGGGDKGGDKGGEEETTWKPVPVNAAALKNFIRGDLLLVGEGEEEPCEKLKGLAVATLKFLEGKITPKTYHKKWAEAFQA